MLCPLQDCEPPSGELLQLIEARWKSLDSFTSAFNGQAASVQVCLCDQGGEDGQQLLNAALQVRRCGMMHGANGWEQGDDQGPLIATGCIEGSSAFASQGFVWIYTRDVAALLAAQLALAQVT
jgi:hypothetical protein